MKILFLGEYDTSEITIAPIKVARELFINLESTENEIRFYCYFREGENYNRFQKLFGKKKESKNIYRFGIFPLIHSTIKFKPNLVHFLTPELYYYVLLALKPFLKFKIVYSNHSIISLVLKKYKKVSCFQRLRFRLIERMAFSFSDRVLTLSELESRFIRRFLMVPKTRIKTVNNGFNYYPVIKRYSDSNDILRVITVGSFTRLEKGLIFLIKTLSELNLKIEITICYYEKQDTPNLDYSRKLKIIIRKPLNEKELREEIVKNDLYIASSEYEPFNMALLEAMSTGIIIIASSRVGLTERFNPKLESLVFQNSNTNDLINRINFYLKLDKVQKLLLSREIVNFTKSYSWDIVTESYNELYEDLVIE